MKIPTRVHVCHPYSYIDLQKVIFSIFKEKGKIKNNVK